MHLAPLWFPLGICRTSWSGNQARATRWPYLCGYHQEKGRTSSTTWFKPTRGSWAWRPARTGSTTSPRWSPTILSVGEWLLFTFAFHSTGYHLVLDYLRYRNFLPRHLFAASSFFISCECWLNRIVWSSEENFLLNSGRWFFHFFSFFF